MEYWNFDPVAIRNNINYFGMGCNMVAAAMSGNIKNVQTAIVTMLGAQAVTEFSSILLTHGKEKDLLKQQYNDELAKLKSSADVNGFLATMYSVVGMYEVYKLSRQIINGNSYKPNIDSYKHKIRTIIDSSKQRIKDAYQSLVNTFDSIMVNYQKKGIYGFNRRATIKGNNILDVEGIKWKKQNIEKTKIFPEDGKFNKKVLDKHLAEEYREAYDGEIKNLNDITTPYTGKPQKLHVNNIEGAGFDVYIPENSYVLNGGERKVPLVISDTSELTTVIKYKDGAIEQISYYQYGCLAFQVDIMGHSPDYLPHWHKYDYPDNINWKDIRDDTHYLGEVE